MQHTHILVRMWTKLFHVFAIFFLLANICSAQEDHRHRKQPPQAYEREGRDEYQKPDEVLAALKIKKTDAIADIGAGSGYFARRFAKQAAVVYAIDIDEAMLRYIHDYVEKNNQRNIVTVLSPTNDPMLPPDSVDLVFISNTLHHLTQRADYYKRIGRILKNNGRFAIVDYHKKKLPIGPPVDEKLSREEVLKEINTAGFKLEEELKFLPYQYYLIFRWTEK